MTFSFKAVAFDLDGTLVDSIADLAVAANRVREALGLTALAAATVESYVGDGAASLVARVLADSKAAEPDDSALQQEGMRYFNQFYLDKLAEHTRVYPSVIETLSSLTALGVKLACVTNKPARFTEPLLMQLGLTAYFELIVSGDSLPEKKPHALPLRYTAQQFGLDASELLMIGDSENDVLSARAAGCSVFAVSYGYAAEANGLGADKVIDRLSDLLLG